MHPHLQASGEADASTHTHPLPSPTGLSVDQADVEVCEREPSRNLQKHIVSFAAFYSLALLWSADCSQLFGSPVVGGGEVEGGGAVLLRSIVSHADSFQTKQPPPSPRRSIWHSWLGWGQLRGSSCRQMFAPPLWINTGRASAGVPRFILYIRWTMYGHAKP